MSYYYHHGGQAQQDRQRQEVEKEVSKLYDGNTPPTFEEVKKETEAPKHIVEAAIKNVSQDRTARTQSYTSSVNPRDVQYYATASGKVTYRVGGSAPRGSKQISQQEYIGYKEQLQDKKEARQIIVSKTTGQTLDIPITATAPKGWENLTRGTDQRRLADVKAKQIILEARKQQATARQVGEDIDIHKATKNKATSSLIGRERNKRKERLAMQEDDNRRTLNDTIVNNSKFLALLDSEVEKDTSTKIGEKGWVKDTGKKYASKIYTLGKDTLIGAGKVLYAPNWGIGEKPAIDIGQHKVFKTENIFYDEQVKTTATVGAIIWLGSGKIGGQIVKWGFRGLAGAYGYKTSKTKETEDLAETLFYLTPDIVKLSKKPLQAINKKFNPKFIPYEETGVQVVEDVSIETPINVLKGFETKTVPSVHTTFSTEIKPGTEIKPAELSKVTGWREAINQRSFYTSSPTEAPIQKMVGDRYTETNIWEDIAYKDTPLATQYQPVLYGGYIGIGEGYTDSNIQFSLLPQTPRAFIFRETYVKPTPSYIENKPIKDVVKYQSETAGTYVAAENIKGVSTEGQFTSSPGIEGEPLLKVVEGEGPLKGKFTYYNQLKEVPFIGREKTPDSILKVYDVVTSENKKISFFETGFEEIKPKVGETQEPTNKIDIAEYNKNLKSKQISSGDLFKSSFYSSKAPSPGAVTLRELTTTEKESLAYSRKLSYSNAYLSSPSYSSSFISSPISSSSSSSRSGSSSSGSSSSGSSSSGSSSSSSSSGSSSSGSSSSSSSSGSSSSSSSSSGSSSSGSSSSGSSSGSSSSGSSSSGSSSGSSSSGSSGYFFPRSSTPPPTEKTYFGGFGEKKKNMFSVLVRRKGKFKEIARTDTIQEAFVRGKVNVDTTAAASFKIQPSEPSDIISKFKSYLPTKKFRRSQREEGVFIEKRKYRISTPGEKGEITLRGLQFLKQKNSLFGGK